jgi:hypothetical protein
MVAIYMGTKGPYAASKEIEASSTIINSATSLIVIEQLPLVSSWPKLPTVPIGTIFEPGLLAATRRY